MFTPQEVSEKVFPKSSGFNSGYQITAVEEFLDTLTEDYTALFKENVTLKAKLKVLAEKVEEYRATEDSMRATLLTAQKMAAKLVQEAQSEHDKLVTSARADADAAKARLVAEIAAEENKLRVAREKTAEFIRRSEELCRQQQQFLSTLPEMDLVPVQQAETVAQDTVENIGQDILHSFAEESAEPVVESSEDIPVEEIFAQNMPQDDPIAEDMTRVFNLDELKFGRNYTGEN